MGTLWVSLHGGNGHWAQQRAMELWEAQQNDHQNAQKDFAIREEHRLAMEAEAERRRKAEEEARRALFNTAEQERRRKLAQEEVERLAREAEAGARRKQEEEERERRRQQPRPCEKCSGTGKCAVCNGHGMVRPPPKGWSDV